MPQPPDIFVGISVFARFMYDWGWIPLPFVLFFAWRALWLYYVELRYIARADWITLELKIPHTVESTPKAMEQIFAGLHGMKTRANLKEHYLEGKHQLHISMEIVGTGGTIHFFIRTPRQFQRLIESQIYAQYKDAEITEVEDYTAMMPPGIPNEEYEAWGTELIFTKDDAYPIRTYRFFEEPSSEKKFVDPLAALMELLGELGEGEHIWVQYLMKPTGDEWQRKGQYLIDRLIGKRSAKTSSGTNIPEEIFQFFSDMFTTLFLGQEPAGVGSEVKKEKEGPETLMQHLPPGMKDTVAALEESISKHGFEAGIRILYIAKTESFQSASIAAVLGAFKQFSTYNLNGFKPNNAVSPSIDYMFKKTREHLRKKKLYQHARTRYFVRNKIISNTEELATIYHVPSIVMEVPLLPKITAKKAEPPAGLPII